MRTMHHSNPAASSVPDDLFAPVFAVCDRRQDNGQLRILAEFSDDSAAQQRAATLRLAGKPVQVMLILRFSLAPISDAP